MFLSTLEDWTSWSRHASLLPEVLSMSPSSTSSMDDDQQQNIEILSMQNSIHSYRLYIALLAAALAIYKSSEINQDARGLIYVVVSARLQLQTHIYVLKTP